MPVGRNRRVDGARMRAQDRLRPAGAGGKTFPVGDDFGGDDQGSRPQRGDQSAGDAEADNPAAAARDGAAKLGGEPVAVAAADRDHSRT